MKRLTVLFVLTLLAVVVPLSFTHADNINQRPISDFVNAQGTYCIDDGAGGCLIFVPPVANFIGWTDPTNSYGLSMDYAGLADKKIQELTGGTRSFGTTFSGLVTEQQMSDGRALVEVNLRTDNALTFIADLNTGDFNTGQLLFGSRVPDIINGSTPVLGSSLLKVRFINLAPGAPLPDLISPDYELLSLAFNGQATGVNPDGNTYRAHVIQVGLYAPAKVPERDYPGDVYPAEHITLQRVGN